MTESKKLNQLIKKIIDDLEWGSPHSWSTKNFKMLAGMIRAKTNHSTPNQQLKELFLSFPLNEKVSPRQEVKEALAKFAGYHSWEHYAFNNSESRNVNLKRHIKTYDARLLRTGYFIKLIIALLILTGIWFLLHQYAG